MIGAGVNGRAAATSLGRRPRRAALGRGSGSSRSQPSSASASRERGGRTRGRVVVTVTPGREISAREGSPAGQHVSLMGADGPGKAEIAVEEIRRPVFCDEWEQASHGGELAAAVEAARSRGRT